MSKIRELLIPKRGSTCKDSKVLEYIVSAPKTSSTMNILRRGDLPLKELGNDAGYGEVVKKSQ